MKRKILSILLIVVMLQGFFYTVIAATTSELEQEKANLNETIETKTEEKEEVEDELDAQMDEITKLDSSIQTTENEINALQMQLDNLDAEIVQKEKEIEEKQAEYEKNQALSEERLVVMYEQGGTSFLDVLLSSANIVDFLNNYYLLSQLTECDIDLLESLEKEKTEIENAKVELEEKKNEVETVKAEQQSKNATLKSQKAEREQKVSALTEEQKALEEEIAASNAKLKEVDLAIAEAMAKAMKEEEEAKNSGTSGSAGSSFDGTFIWPLDYSPRRVTSRMKYRWGRWHKGIDIGTNAEIGKRVIAAASGTVIYSAYQSGSSSAAGYGNYLIIYHGNGYCTLYAHMDSKSVSTGQKVSQGQTIGYSGNTGGVDPHLHFEIRKATSISDFFGNNWLDPLDYLPGGYTIVD